MPFKSICLLYLAFISLLYSRVADAEGDAIVWAKNPSPPFHIMSGKLKGYGICDVMTDKLDALLEDLDTSVEIYPHPRVNKYVGEAENLCFPCMIKREDSGTYTYSDTTMRYPALGVIIHRSLLARLGLSENTPVSFAKLMSIHTLAFGLPSARKYPDALQSILNNHIGQPHILEIAGTEGPLRVLRQIARGRLDYTIDYPSVLKYFSMTEREDSLVFLPVTEMGDTSVEGAIGCTNNPWGKRAVGHINGVLKRLKQDREFKENQAFWLNVIE